MAVEAHHLHLFPAQRIRSREIINAVENQGSMYGAQMGFVTPATGSGSILPFYNTAATVAASADDASKSRLTFNDLSANSRKRSRGTDLAAFSFLGEDVSSHVQRQQLDIDGLITHHVEKVRTELLERRKRISRQIMAAVEAGLSRLLLAKEQEIERIAKLNWELEERIRGLCAENQMWRDLAQSNEATANVLRTNLEQVLVAQQVRVKEEDQINGDNVEDAESCCGGDNLEEEEEKQRSKKRVCRRCWRHEPSVLLLQCRHLCVCAECGPQIDACPICKSHKTGSVNINMS